MQQVETSVALHCCTSDEHWCNTENVPENKDTAFKFISLLTHISHACNRLKMMG